MIEIDRIMAELSRERPVFHSEADLQHALAWQIHRASPECGVRLEYRPFPEKSMHLDLWLRGPGIGLELKYTTRLLDHVHEGEAFSLKPQEARDTRRYDFLKDISRLERVSRLKHARGGFAVLLTNDQLYWDPPGPKGRNNNDDEFRIHEGRRIGGELNWSERTSAGTKEGRENPIRLDRCYHLQWRDYSEVGQQPNGRFRYLTVQVPG